MARRVRNCDPAVLGQVPFVPISGTLAVLIAATWLLSGCSKADGARERTEEPSADGATLDASEPPSPGGGAASDGADADPGTSTEPPSEVEASAEKLYERNANPRRSLVTDGKDLFWGEFTDETGLLMWAAAISGTSTPRNLGRWYDYASAQSIALGPEHVYWFRDDGGASVISVPKAGGDERVTVLPVPDGADPLSLGVIVYSDERLWIATRGCTHLVQMNPVSGDSVLFEMSPYDNVGGGTGLAVREGTAYCGNGATIHSLSVATGVVEKVVDGQDVVVPLTWVGTALYFANNKPVAGQDGRLMRWEPGDDAASDVGTVFGFTYELLYDAQRNALFWATGLSFLNGRIAQFAIGSSATEQLLEKQSVMGGITHDADYLYWLGSSDIFRTPKPPRN